MDEEFKKKYQQYLDDRASAITTGSKLTVDSDILAFDVRRIEILERMEEIQSNQASIFLSAINDLPCGDEYLSDDVNRERKLEDLEYSKLLDEYNMEEYKPDPDICQECGDYNESCDCGRCVYCEEKEENCECEEGEEEEGDDDEDED